VKPSLPQDDSHHDKRQREIARDKAVYKYSYAYPPGVALAEKVPSGDSFNAGYVVHVLGVYGIIIANFFAMKIAAWWANEPHPPGPTIVSMIKAMMPAAGRWNIFEHTAVVTSRMPSKPIERVEDYERFYALVPKPPVTKAFDHGSRLNDITFAYQRLAGVNPMMIERLAAPPQAESFPVTAEAFTDAVGEDDSMEAAADQGRLFIADYPLLDGAPLGKWDRERKNKYLNAPKALFAWKRENGVEPGHLVPVAIQCGQTPDPQHFPVFTPRDGHRWQMAKTVVQIADGNMHEPIMHLGRTHFVMEATIVAAMRCLAPAHPLRILLTPHFEFTLALNDIAANNLVAPGGTVAELFAARIEATLQLTANDLATHDVYASDPESELKRRGVLEREGLPKFPYRDDALPVWKAIRDFVGGYVDLYYTEDAAVGADGELAAFTRELASPVGGKLHGIPQMNTAQQLAHLMSVFIWTASAGHAALNFAQFPYMGLVANMPGSGYAPAPNRDTPDHLDSYLEMFPPMDRALLHFNTVYQLSSIRINKLGDYPSRHFRNRRVAPLVKQFQSALSTVDKQLVARDASRIISYPFLRPSRLPASIHI
jgi:arachidonate 15-lipoxygenase